jgi:hypothetical protein
LHSCDDADPEEFPVHELLAVIDERIRRLEASGAATSKPATAARRSGRKTPRGSPAEAQTAGTLPQGVRPPRARIKKMLERGYSMGLRDPNARSKELRSAQRRAKKLQKIEARQAARQARKGGAKGPPDNPSSQAGR